MKKTLFFLLFLLSQHFFSQEIMKGQVLDFDTTVPVAIANIGYNNVELVADWEGKFEIKIAPGNQPIVFSKKGYYTKKG